MYKKKICRKTAKNLTDKLNWNKDSKIKNIGSSTSKKKLSFRDSDRF